MTCARGDSADVIIGSAKERSAVQDSGARFTMAPDGDIRFTPRSNLIPSCCRDGPEAKWRLRSSLCVFVVRRVWGHVSFQSSKPDDDPLRQALSTQSRIVNLAGKHVQKPRFSTMTWKGVAERSQSRRRCSSQVDQRHAARSTASYPLRGVPRRPQHL